MERRRTAAPVLLIITIAATGVPKNQSDILVANKAC